MKIFFQHLQYKSFTFIFFFQYRSSDFAIEKNKEKNQKTDNKNEPKESSLGAPIVILSTVHFYIMISI